jgi:hypothetical protein
MNPEGSGLVYSTFLAGTAGVSSLRPRAIAIDALGAAYIAGSANIQSFQPMPDTLRMRRRRTISTRGKTQ